MLRSRLPPTPFDTSEATLLEADVMRFMAILAFCLMAIFALIAAIPAARSPEVEIANAGMVEARYQATVQRLQAAAAFSRQLAEEIEERRRQLGRQLRTEAQLAERTARLEREGQRLATEYAALSARLETARAELAATNDELEALGEALGSRQRTLSVADREIRQVDRAVSREEANLERVQAELQQSAASADPQAEPQILADLRPEPERRRGFTLRFASTDVLLQLLRSGRVRVFAELGTGLWAARRAGGFEPSPPPTQPYELTDSPGSRLVEDFRRSSGVLSATLPRWLVTFDQDLLNAIGRRMEEQPGGDLLIHADGRVSRE